MSSTIFCFVLENNHFIERKLYSSLAPT